jgi:hypothetical protein
LLFIAVCDENIVQNGSVFFAFQLNTLDWILYAITEASKTNLLPAKQRDDKGEKQGKVRLQERRHLALSQTEKEEQGFVRPTIQTTKQATPCFLFSVLHTQQEESVVGGATTRAGNNEGHRVLLFFSNCLQSALEKGLGIVKEDDWYRHAVKDVSQQLPSPVNQLHRYVSLFEVLQVYFSSSYPTCKVLYPNVYWTEGKFKRCPGGTWKDVEKTKSFLLSLHPQLQIREMTDWYKISKDQVPFCYNEVQNVGVVTDAAQFTMAGGGGCLSTFGSLCQALQFGFPEIVWLPHLFATKKKKSSQRYHYPFLADHSHF